MLSAPDWHIYLNKEDDLPITLPSFLPSLTLRPSSVGWMAAGCRKSCLMVFGVGRFPCRYCSLAGWCVTDSGRSLVPSPTYPACLARLAWISWRTIAPILDSSRYSWKTCGQHTGFRKLLLYFKGAVFKEFPQPQITNRIICSCANKPVCHGTGTMKRVQRILILLGSLLPHSSLLKFWLQSV